MINLGGFRGQDNHAAERFAFAPAPRNRMVVLVEAKEGKAIVIIDDEVSFTELLEHLLGEHFDCPIRTFSNPLRMLEALPRLEVGIVVTDYYMPHRTGLELIRQVGELSLVPPPCILITGHALDEGEESARPVHLKAVLPKPFRWQELADLIEKYWPADLAPPRRGSHRSLHG